MSTRSKLAAEAVVTLGAVMTPLIILSIGVLPIFMKLWVGEAFSEHAAPIGIVLLVGIWVNSLAYIPAAHLNSINRPDLPAKFHAYELLPFLAILWVGLHYYGLIGAAWAWTLRIAIDAAFLFVIGGETPGWTRVLPGAALVLTATLIAPRTVLSTRTFLECSLLLIGIIWSWKASLTLRSLVTGLWLQYSRRGN